MKKFLVIILAAMLHVGAWAAGESQANPIVFNWEEANIQETTDTVWYCVHLAPLKEQENPVLALYLTNLTNQTQHVTVTAALSKFSKESREYDIDAHSDKTWSVGASLLMSRDSIFIALTAQGKIALSAKAYEAEDIDESCIDATRFNWATGHNVIAGKESWFRVNLSSARNDESKEIELVITNNGSGSANITAGVSPDCPCSGLTEYQSTLSPGTENAKRISRAMINMLQDSLLYIKMVADQPVHVDARLVEKEASGATPISCAATELELNTDYIIPAGVYEYKIAVDSLKGHREMPEVTIMNMGTASAHIKAEVAFACGTNPGATDMLEREVVLGVEAIVSKEVEKNMVDGIKKDVEYVYLRITTDQALLFRGRLKHVHEGEQCKTSIDFDWEHGNQQLAGISTVWYAIDIKEAKNPTEPKNIQLNIKNLGSATANIKADISFSCTGAGAQTVNRTIAAATTMSKVLDYATISMAPDTLYVGITTDQKIHIWAGTEDITPTEPDEACLTAIPFDWTYGHKQSAGDTVWYKVGLNDLREETMIPVVNIHNLSATQALTIYGVVSTECPDSLPNQERNLSLVAGGEYEKEIALNLVNNLSVDTIYIRLVGTQDFSFNVTKRFEKEGESCASAEVFNWVSGIYYTATDPRWYSIDLQGIKESGKDIHLTLQNRSTTNSCTVKASIAVTCPCDQPQEQKTKLAPGQTVEKTLVNSMLEMAGETLWIRIEAEEDLFIKADTITPEPFDTITACEGATMITMNTLYSAVAGENWYYLLADTLQKYLAMDEVYTPQLIINNSATAQTITAEVAYHCPVTQAMQSKQIALVANDTIHKILERSLAEQAAGKDTIFVRLTGTAEFSFIAKMMDPNRGNDCAHATILSTDSCYEQAAGEGHWYKLRIKKLTETPHTMSISLKNIGTASGKVQVGVYTNCDGEPVQSGSRTLAVGQVLTRDSIDSNILYAISDSIALVFVQSEQKIEFCFRAEEAEPLEEPITACEDAIKVAANVLYTQNIDVTGTDTTWYCVNIRELRENTSGDATLTIRNIGTGVATMSAEISYECPVTYAMTDKKMKLNPGEEYERIIPREQLDNMAKDLAWVRVITTENITFQLVVELEKGKDPINYINFELESCKVHPAGDSLYYGVVFYDMDDNLLIPEGKDLQLSIRNMDPINSCHMEAYIYDNYVNARKEIPLESLTYTIEPNGSRTKNIDRTYIDMVHRGSIILYLISEANIEICSSFIEEEQQVTVLDTIQVNRFCVEDSPYYVDSIALRIDSLGLHPERAQKYIDLEDPSTWTWKDTTTTKDDGKLKTLDSIFTFIVHPMTAPKRIDYTTIPEANKPIMQEGMAANVDSLTAWIMRTYKADALANDTVSEIIDDANYYEWQIKMGIEDYTTLSTSAIARGASAAPAYIALEASTNCISVLDTIELIILPMHIDSVVDGEANSCIGDTLNWRGKEIAVLGEMTVYDTVANLEKDTTINGITMSMTYDSLYIYKVHAYAMPEHMIDADDIADWFGGTSKMPVVECGENIQVSTDLTAAIKTMFAQSQEEGETTIDSISWARYDTLDTYGAHGLYYPLEEHPMVMTNDTVVSVAYVAHTECGKLLYGPLFNYDLPGCLPNVTHLKDSICFGDTLQFGCMKLSEQGIYYDTISIASGDSIVELTLKVMKADTLEIENLSVCEGDSVLWFGQYYKQAGTYKDTLYYDGELIDCPRAFGEMTLTILAKNTTDTVVTICQSELPYEWHGQELQAAGVLKDTLTNAAGCDSIVTLTLTVQAPTTAEVEYKRVCYGDTYAWHTWRDSVLSESGTYMDTAHYATGCDSVYYQIEFTVLEDTQHPEAKDTTICEGDVYTWRGNDYIATGIYTDTVRYAEGCDSAIYTLNLTVQAPMTMPTERDTICEGGSILWRDQTLTQAGTYGDTLYYTTGCDSVYYELVLTVQAPTTADVEYKRVCYGDSYTWHTWRDSVLSESGTYMDTAHYATGCDSVYYQIEFTVLEDTKHPEAEDKTICENDVYIWRGHDYEVAGIYNDTVRYAEGCDSAIYILNLTVQAPMTMPTERDTICEGGSVLWHDQTLTQAGTYGDTLYYTTGCDSVYYELVLTVQAPTTADVEYKRVCYGDTYTWHTWRDSVLSESGTYMDTAHYATGCDSVYYQIEFTVLEDTQYPEAEDKTICENDVYIWRGHDYEVAGIYNDTVRYAEGCDSVVYTLNLTVRSIEADTLAEAIVLCEGEDFIWNQYEIYNVRPSNSGYYPHTETDQYGCDSTVVVELVVNPTIYNSIQDTVCQGEPYEWAGFTVDTSKPGVIRLDNKKNPFISQVTGCDSIVEFELFVAEAYNITIDTVVCAGTDFKWQTYIINDVKAANDGWTKTVSLMSQFGCDSTVTMVLHVSDKTYGTLDITECDSYTWNGVTYTESTVINDTIANVAGCDSILTINLTINHSSTYTEPNALVYVGEPWNWNEVTIAAVTLENAGEYVYMTENVAGCDSTVTITLEVLIPEEHTLDVNDAVCPGDTYVGRVTSHVINELTSWSDTIRAEISGGVKVDSIYNYTIDVYGVEVVTDSLFLLENIHVICGQEIRLAEVEQMILDMTGENAVSVVWMFLPKGTNTFVPLQSDLVIDGAQTEFTLGYKLVHDSCSNVETDIISATFKIEQATADNTVEYSELKITPLYGHRLYIVDMDSVRKIVPNAQETDVQWFREVGEVDNLNYPDPSDPEDEQVGRGSYYGSQTGAALIGSYYARIITENINTVGCEITLRTKTEKYEPGEQHLPALHPSMANSGDPIEVYNLDEGSEVDIYVYDVQGVRIGSAHVVNQENVVLEAAPIQGFYTVEVVTNGEHVALKYIVR